MSASPSAQDPAARREIRVIDTTLRDAHQCLWATRMTHRAHAAGARQVRPRGLRVHRPDGHDPVRRLRALPQGGPVGARAPDAPAARRTRRFRSLIRSKNIVASTSCPTTSSSCGSTGCTRNGFRVIGAFDGLNDVDNIAGQPRCAPRRSAPTRSARCRICESPVHTDELYVRTAKALIERGDVDAIMTQGRRRAAHRRPHPHARCRPARR